MTNEIEIDIKVDLSNVTLQETNLVSVVQRAN